MTETVRYPARELPIEAERLCSVFSRFLHSCIFSKKA